MTEQEIKDIEVEVLGGSDVPKDFEISHLQRTIEQCKTESHMVQCNFRLYKYTRDDAKMKECRDNLKKIRDIVEGAEKRLAELRG